MLWGEGEGSRSALLNLPQPLIPKPRYLSATIRLLQLPQPCRVRAAVGHLWRHHAVGTGGGHCCGHRPGHALLRLGLCTGAADEQALPSAGCSASRHKTQTCVVQPHPVGWHSFYRTETNTAPCAAPPTLLVPQSQLSSFTLVPSRSGIVRSGDQEAALELLRPAHLVTAQLRGFLFFGIANAISTRLHAAASSLDAAGTGISGSGGGGEAVGTAASPLRAGAQQAADRLYPGSGSKHDGALFALASAPKFLLLDFSRVKGIDATAARTLGALFRHVQLDSEAWQAASTERQLQLQPLQSAI